ncbi:helix-turn-helix domain-containing protein [Serratia marcescens]|uniref:helix-turn-helix domain-containing protein n=1 Tax=Serratia marcescens TaxID=615 RepID=UPI0018D82838|nr:helix-turn-helix domain-containing protein [Serratia marcescens]MBH2910589.1 helix-turn-helix domain-containing protein [Serratia marcescens]HCU0428853.1 helix-turn-helix domain-containing protein [Serratia marcescens]
MKWSELVREHMKTQGVTREKIGNALGKTPGAIGHWLNGRREPSLDEIASILKFLGIQSVTLNSDGTLSSDDGQGITFVQPKERPALTPEQEELLRMFDTLPRAEAARILDEIKTRSAHYLAMYEEMHKKLHGKGRNTEG